MKLYLIRHAKSVDDILGLAQKPDSPLDFHSLNTIKKNESLKPDFAYSSPLMRAGQTAGLLFNDYKVLNFIYEYARPRLLDGVPKDKTVDFWENKHQKDKFDPNWKYDGSESFNDIVKRVIKLIKYLQKNHKDNEKIAIVGHSIFFKHLLGILEFNEKYNTTLFFNNFRLIPWDNLEIKEVDI